MASPTGGLMTTSINEFRNRPTIWGPRVSDWIGLEFGNTATGLKMGTG